MAQEIPERISVLMVEDNPMDVLLTTEILAESEKTSYQVSRVKNGIEALAFLHRKNGYQDAPQPELILLDLNLPRMNGFDFLAEMRKDTDLAAIPVIVLTTSEVRKDIDRAKEFGVDGYLIKPIDLETFESIALPH